MAHGMMLANYLIPHHEGEITSICNQEKLWCPTGCKGFKSIMVSKGLSLRVESSCWKHNYPLFTTTLSGIQLPSQSCGNF